MPDFIRSVLTSVVASGLLTAALIWLSREWLSVRLKASIQHEYDQKLERLKAQNDVALAHVSGALEQQARVVAAAHASFAEGQKAAMDRTLRAIDDIWKRVVYLRSGLPPVLTLIDVLTVDDFGTFKNDPYYRQLDQGWPAERVASLMDKDAELARPYIGEYAWAVFYAYQVILLRVALLTKLAKEDAALVEWYKDSKTRQLVTSVLTASELQEFSGAVREADLAPASAGVEDSGVRSQADLGRGIRGGGACAGWCDPAACREPSAGDEQPGTSRVI